jgi:hypothetical protein
MVLALMVNRDVMCARFAVQVQERNFQCSLKVLFQFAAPVAVVLIVVALMVAAFLVLPSALAALIVVCCSRRKLQKWPQEKDAIRHFFSYPNYTNRKFLCNETDAKGSNAV